jgi:hypothetical protein
MHDENVFVDFSSKVLQDLKEIKDLRKKASPQKHVFHLHKSPSKMKNTMQISIDNDGLSSYNTSKL